MSLAYASMRYPYPRLEAQAGTLRKPFIVAKQASLLPEAEAIHRAVYREE